MPVPSPRTLPRHHPPHSHPFFIVPFTSTPRPPPPPFCVFFYYTILAGPLPSQLRPGDVRRAQGHGHRRDPGHAAHRRGRALLQRQGYPDHHQDRRGQRVSEADSQVRQSVSPVCVCLFRRFGF